MKQHKLLYVYILKCADGSYYTGVTNNLERRLIEHNTGIDRKAYTFSRRPIELVYSESFTSYDLAINWETKIKKWSHKKKEALINSNWEKLKEAASCKNITSHIHISTPLDVTKNNIHVISSPSINSEQAQSEK